MSETKWRTLGVGDERVAGYQFRPQDRSHGWTDGCPENAGVPLTTDSVDGYEYRAPVLDEAAEPVPQPVVVAAVIAPEHGGWPGECINVTADGAWWMFVCGAWTRIALPIAAKGGE